MPAESKASVQVKKPDARGLVLAEMTGQETRKEA
jgi:hypothetical protein